MTDLLIADTITPPDWMQSTAVTRVIKALGPKNARFVGGCVRNMLLDIPVTDIDIATRHQPPQTITLLEAANIKAIPTGIDHGTITAVIDRQTIEITTLRKDVATDGRRAVIAFSDCWTEDAQRRDFTMNTLLADHKGNIYDPLKSGLADLKNRAVIFAGNPETRIQEDILRILRFFRFHALYGAGDPDPAALKACQKHAHLMSALSKERIMQEYLKILNSDKAVATLSLMHNHGVMPELTTINQPHFEKLSLMARLAGFEQAARDQYLALSNAQKKEIGAINKTLQNGQFDTEAQIKKTLYYYGREATRQAYLITNGAQNNTVENWPISTFPITGVDLIAKGYQQGEVLGTELKRLEAEWVNNDFKS